MNFCPEICKIFSKLLNIFPKLVNLFKSVNFLSGICDLFTSKKMIIFQIRGPFFKILEFLSNLLTFPQNRWNFVSAQSPTWTFFQIHDIFHKIHELSIFVFELRNFFEFPYYFEKKFKRIWITHFMFPPKVNSWLANHLPKRPRVRWVLFWRPSAWSPGASISHWIYLRGSIRDLLYGAWRAGEHASADPLHSGVALLGRPMSRARCPSFLFHFSLLFTFCFSLFLIPYFKMNWI